MYVCVMKWVQNRVFEKNYKGKHSSASVRMSWIVDGNIALLKLSNAS